jgi:pseudouridine-5'-monophosphatase
MVQSNSTITHVIYDLDGLLLDTETLYTEATRQIVGRYGKTFDWSIKANMIGRPALDSARHLINSLDLSITPEQYLEEREQLLADKFPTAQPLPGAERLTQHLAANGIPQALATSSSQHLLQLKIQHHRTWFNLFDTVVTGDDPEVKHGKPAPDIFLTAAKRLGGAEPKHCLVFEDAPSGMEAALAAKMSVVVVPDPHMDKAVYAKASQILTSLTEFDPSVWELPPFAS